MSAAQTQTQTEIDEDNCPICFGEAELETFCEHLICRGCAEEMWERRMYKCPLCREDIEDWLNALVKVDSDEEKEEEEEEEEEGEHFNPETVPEDEIEREIRAIELMLPFLENRLTQQQNTVLPIENFLLRQLYNADIRRTEDQILQLQEHLIILQRRKAERDARLDASSVESVEMDLRRVLAELIIERDTAPPIPEVGDIMVMFEQNHHLGQVERRIQGIQELLANLEAERREKMLMGQEDINIQPQPRPFLPDLNTEERHQEFVERERDSIPDFDRDSDFEIEWFGEENNWEAEN